MYLMIADEADQDGSKEFLVFGGVFFPSAKLLTITNEIERLRRNCGYPVGTVLKSAVNTRPKNISPSQHAKIKNEMLALAQREYPKLCV